MSLPDGTRIGPYEILASIGAGGMGEVYRARDSRLGREVAVKILPQSLARDNDRLHRFEQESRAVAALNHPNILAIYDVGEHDGIPFLVSELLDGEGLREILSSGPLSQRKTIDYGVQVAHGLAAAHEKGIVHRDLKPENLFVTRDGRVKILDFGLAKLTEKIAGSSSDGITLTGSPTAIGTVMGTASYMAPEQVRGQAVDPRTDIFAFGAVLYEMLSGNRTFLRETPAETMTAVLKEDPAELPPQSLHTSPALDRIVRRCLEKSPEQRFHSAKDLSFALASLSGTESSATLHSLPEKHAPVSWARWMAIVAALLFVSTAVWYFTSRNTRHPRMQFAIAVPGETSHMALSLDGAMLVFVSPDEESGKPMLFLERVGLSDAVPLPGTQGASYPFWSPDGAYVAFFASGKLQKISIAGGPPQVMANVQSARGGSWGSRNVIVYEPDASSPLWRINADGTGAAPIYPSFFTKEDQSHRWPVFLPDGTHFLFWAGNFENRRDDRFSGIYAGSLDGKDRKLVILCHCSFALDSGHLFYADDNRHLVSVVFDSSSFTVSGNAAIVADAVGFQPSTYWVAVTAAQNGTLVYNASAGAALSVLIWVDRNGKELGRIGDPGVMANPMLSPDGGRVALDISDQKANNVDVWIESATNGGNSRFTFDPAEEVVPVWSRDQATIVYRSAAGNGGLQLVVKAANGLERERTILEAGGFDDIFPNSWAPGDQQILSTYENPERHYLTLVPLKAGKAIPFLPGPGNQANGQISPDGKWVAYASDESGNWEIYVTTFPGASGKWQVSRGGGTEPRWRGDGKEIFYLGPTGMLIAVPVSPATTFSTGVPTSLFQVHGRAPISSSDIFSYDVSKDGSRFLLNRYIKPEKISPLNIILNADSAGN